MYYKLNENRFCNKSLIGEYSALSKLYYSLKDYGTPSNNHEDLFIYCFSGIYQKGTSIVEKYRSEIKMIWEWKKEQTLPVIITLLYQEGTTGIKPYKPIASYFGIEETNGFSSMCNNVGKKSLDSIREMLINCGFTGFNDIYQQIEDEKENRKKKHP